MRPEIKTKTKRIQAFSNIKIKNSISNEGEQLTDQIPYTQCPHHHLALLVECESPTILLSLQRFLNHPAKQPPK